MRSVARLKSLSNAWNNLRVMAALGQSLTRCTATYNFVGGF